VESDPRARFVDQLRQLRIQAGEPTLVDLEEQDPTWLNPSTVSDLLTGKGTRVPDWERITAFVTACVRIGNTRERKMPPQETLLEQWRHRHEGLAVALDQTRPRGQNTPVDGTAAVPVQTDTITGGVHHPVPPSWRVPKQLPAAPHGFVGRVDRLADLDRRAPTTVPDTTPDGQQEAPMVVISAIGGTGGIGKTWLALTWAHRNLHKFPDGQLFVNLHGFSPTGRPSHPADVLGGFLDALGVDRDRQPDDPDRRAGLYRSLVADKRMLVVLDNAATTEQVTPLLPGGHRCTVLITSRNHLHGLTARHGARPVHLDVLTDTEAHTLLATALGPDRAANNKQAVAELIRLCGKFPLALGLIAARAAADPRLPLSDAVAELRTSGLDALDSEDPTASLPTVLSWSLHHLTDQQQQAFALVGIAPGPDTGLPAAASLTGFSERDTHAVLRALADASLIDRTPGGRYTMHDLVRAYATSTAINLPVEVRAMAMRRVLDFYLHTAATAQQLLRPDGDPANLDLPAPSVHTHPLPDVAAAWAWFDTERFCLLTAQHIATTHAWHSIVWWMAWCMDTFHTRRGHRHDWLAVWQAAVDASTHLSAARLVYAHHRLGRGHTDLGDHKDAITHLHKALTLAEHHHDPVNQGHIHYAFALAWEIQGDVRQALEHARIALDLFRGLNEPAWEANALNAVGWCLGRQGDYDTARDHCQTALTLHRHHNIPSGEAATLDSLGYIDHHNGQQHKAIDHYNQALTLYRDLGNTYAAADTLDALGHPHAALGQYEQTHTVWRKALELYREQGRDEDAARVQRQLNDLDVHAHDGDQPPHDTKPAN
jgi:tetratricopeptide (TPR) repeat protein